MTKDESEESIEGLDVAKFKVKIDHFDQIHVLGENSEVEGAPNFRQVSGFPVFGCAQPTKDGFLNVLDKLPLGTDQGKIMKTIWFNMRVEPVIYINGKPCAPRQPDSMHGNLILDKSVEEIENIQSIWTEFIKETVERDENRNLSINMDKKYMQNPLDRENIEEIIEVDSIEGLDKVTETLSKTRINSHFSSVRIPAIENYSPREDCFDMLIDSLKQEPAGTNCVFSCQAGYGRTTLGMVITCLVKEIQISSELRKMAEIGLVPKATVEDLIKQKFEFNFPPDENDDPLLKGEFDVIKELLNFLPGAKDGKAKVDRILDLCGPPPNGSGLLNLRKCIIETKWLYDLASEDKQQVYKEHIMNFLERYFNLICFATYSIAEGPRGFQKSFVTWMDDHSDLRKMIVSGRQKIEWYRQVDSNKLASLKRLMNDPNYKKNLPSIIKSIFELSFLTYSDLPKGPIKSNSMRKMTAKILLEILPQEIGSQVQRRLEDQDITPDLVTLISLVSFYSGVVV